MPRALRLPVLVCQGLRGSEIEFGQTIDGVMNDVHLLLLHRELLELRALLVIAG